MCALTAGGTSARERKLHLCKVGRPCSGDCRRALARTCMDAFYIRKKTGPCTPIPDQTGYRQLVDGGNGSWLRRLWVILFSASRRHECSRALALGLAQGPVLSSPSPPLPAGLHRSQPLGMAASTPRMACDPGVHTKILTDTCGICELPALRHTDCYRPDQTRDSDAAGH